MASTDSASSTAPTPPCADSSIRPLAAADLPGCLALSLSAGWNQNAADWRMMLALGEGWGIEGTAGDGSRSLAASIVAIPYGETGDGARAGDSGGCAWVSMVLVSPGFRRSGLAGRLLRHALDWLKARGATPVLDATPTGYPVYVQEGFAPTWGFRRYRREAVIIDAAGRAPASQTRAVTPGDWAAIAAYDAPAFGGNREGLLRALAGRMPQAARIAERGGRIAGFVFGRDGREACQVGPLLAEDPQIAQALLDDVLDTVAMPVYVDLADRHQSLLPGLVARGFVLQRPFTRMVHGATEAPGDPGRVVLVAGPELG